MNPTIRSLAVGVAAGAAMLLSASAYAGQEPVVAVVGYDVDIDTFYISKKLHQFTHFFLDPQYDNPLTDGQFNVEAFRSNAPINKDEVCVSANNPPPPEWIVTNPNALIPHNNAGWFEWDVILPKKPLGQLNIVVQCGVMKDNTYPQFPVDLCAGETGERIGQGFCTRQPTGPYVNPVVPGWLPLITVRATPGPFATPGFDVGEIGPKDGGGPLPVGPQGLVFTGGDDYYTLLGYRVPGPFGGNGAFSLLNGDSRSRMLLKACQSEVVLAKFPVTGFQAGNNKPEHDLEAGDRIHVRLFIPAGHSMDIYCHKHSVRVQYNGDPQTLLPEVIRVESPELAFGPTGWGGWSCPAGTRVVGGGYEPANASVQVSEAAQPGSDSGLYPVYPHYTFPAGETGWVVQNDNTGKTLKVYALCAPVV